MSYLGAIGLIALGVAIGLLICIWERSLRRRLKRACKPTRGRPLRRWLCVEARRYLGRTDICYQKHNKRIREKQP